ncbi:MAG: DUF4837 family protein [Flavobacteriaceae bacterium]|nr:DUF4837 family protein [Flavobacteriaceae bacterium]
MRNIFLILISSFVLLASCEDTTSTQKTLPDSVGAINEFSLVMPNQQWKGRLGDSIRSYFASPVHGLPTIEPLFNIHHINPQLFSDFVRNSRAVILIKNGAEAGYTIRKDVFARPQTVIQIQGNTEEEIIGVLQEKATEIIELLKQKELEENQRRLLLALSSDKTLEETFGLKLRIPSYYKVVKQEENFVWIQRQIKKGTMGLVVYALPSGFYTSDSTYVADIYKTRDSIGKKYIPGPDPEKNYMISEYNYIPVLNGIEINGLKVAEFKGMWQMFAYPMAGPFVHYIFNDKANDRLLVVEGFMFAPHVDKRNKMFELEAIIKSAKLESPKK